VDLNDLVAGLRDSWIRPKDLLVGFENNSDAAVFRLCDDLAIVQSVDYIAPVSNDPYVYGAIAAANALSDLYAVAARPRLALNVCVFPEDIDREVLQRILMGALEKVQESGAALVGGHTVRGRELQFGLSVTGTIDPRRVVRNNGACAGDWLVLTKALGTGLFVSAYRAGLIAENELRPALEVMLALNRRASELMVEHSAHSSTDISGFGLVCHALEMARGSMVTFRVFAAAVPVLAGALELIGRGATTSITEQNRRAAESNISVTQDISNEHEAILFDPQTSGGLLVALPPSDAQRFVDALKREDMDGWVIGEAVPLAGDILVDVRA
jgi:selenide, water dikinase